MDGWPEREAMNMNNGRFGEYGGQYIPETLMRPVQELAAAYDFYRQDKDFQS